jgi:O-glycosyl hydrolase
LFDLSNNKYLSVTISANPAVRITFDIFDVYGKRYGLLPAQNVGVNATTLVFNFNQTPSEKDFDFTKVATVLMNTQGLMAYNGTITITALKIGDKADNAPAAVAPIVKIDPIGSRSVNVNAGTQTIKISGLADGSLANKNPISLQVTSSNTALVGTPTLSSVVNGEAMLTYNVTAGQTGSSTITVTASASGSTSTVKTFAVNVITPNTGSATAINITPGTKHQTIDGFGAFTAGNEGDGGFGDKYQRVLATAVNNLGVSLVRSELPPDFEIVNDNDDPNVINPAGYNVNALPVKKFIEQYNLGVRKFITTLWTPPAYMKRNLSNSAIQNFFEDNRLDSNFTAEFAEYIVAYIKIMKQETGIDIFAISLQNELQFNEPYNSAKYTPEEYVNIVKAVGRRFKKEGIKTLLFGPENLPAQADYSSYVDAIFNDAEAKNYFNIYAIHNYDATGTAQGSASSGDWGNILTSARRFPAIAGALPAGHTGNGGSGIRTAQTETSGYFQDWDNALRLAATIHRALVFGNISMWVYWSVESGENSEYGLLNGEKTGNSPLMYASKQYYKFVRPGAVRVDASTSDANILVSAFQNADPDNSTAVVMINNSTTATITTKINGLGTTKMYLYRSADGQNAELVDSTTNGTVVLPPASIVTAVSKKEIISGTVQKEEAEATGKMVLYPNPAHGTLNISLPSGSYSKVRISDLLGRTVITKALLNVTGGTEVLSLDGLDKGLYILTVEGDKKFNSTVLVD